MNTRLDSTASSCGVSTSGMRLTAPRVPWIVSSSVSPVSTRVVIRFSSSFSRAQDWMSLDSGIFSGTQKLPTSRSHTSRSLGSSMRFQLMACSGLMSSCLIVVISSSRRCAVGPFEKLVLISFCASLEHAGHAVLHLRARQRLLAQPDVVQRLDALAPRINLGPVDVAGGHGVFEEQGERQALVDVLSGGCVGVDDLLVADLVGVLVEL